MSALELCNYIYIYIYIYKRCIGLLSFMLDDYNINIHLNRRDTCLLVVIIYDFHLCNINCHELRSYCEGK